MSSMWLDEPEAESIDLYDGGESAEGIDGEEDFAAESGYDDGEATRAAVHRRRRRRRAQQLALARRRARARYGRRVPTTTGAALAKVDIESKVQADVLGGALTTQGKRIGATETVLAVREVVNPLQNFLQSSHPDFAANPIVRAGLPLAPLLLLRRPRRGDGFQTLVTDPRTVVVAAVVGLTLVEGRTTRVSDIRITPVPVTAESPPVAVRFLANVVNRNGETIPGKVPKWSSSNTAVATVDENTGDVTGLIPGGFTHIVATVDRVTRDALVEVKGP